MDIYEIRQALNSGKTIYDLSLKVTYYARVSTDKDEQIHSLSAQVNYYNEFIKKCPNWQFVDGYIDEGISGTGVKKRENFLRMIDDAGAHKFDFIVTKEISRFSRNTMDSIQYTQELLKYGVGVLFQSDNINTLLPDSELRLTIMSSVAQDEVRKISERVKFGFKRAIENGVVLGSNRIWGYRKQEGRLVIDQKEAEMICTIFDLYANQMMGIRGIANYLSEHGYRNGNGNPFSFSTIRGIIVNPKYKGYYCGRKSTKIDYKLNTVKAFQQRDWIMYEDHEKVPPIVSEELWEKANAILAKRSAKQSAENKSSYQNKYPYSGKIICGVHHTPYYRSVYRYKSGSKEVWQCREYVRNGKRGCQTPVLYTTEANEIMCCSLQDSFIDKTEMTQKLVRLYSDGDSIEKLKTETVKCRTAMENVMHRKDKLLDLSIDQKISDEEFDLRNNRFNHEYEKLQLQFRELCNEESKNQSIQKDTEKLQAAVIQELNFTDGFSIGVVEAALDRMEVFGTDDKNTVEVDIYLHTQQNGQKYAVQRKYGGTSVCFRTYI